MLSVSSVAVESRPVLLHRHGPEAREHLLEDYRIVTIQDSLDNDVVGVRWGARADLLPDPDHDVPNLELHPCYALDSGFPDRTKAEFVAEYDTLRSDEQQLWRASGSIPAGPRD